MESEDEMHDHFYGVMNETIAGIQEQYWSKVREELKKILVENPEVRAKLLATPSPTTEDDFLDMMIAMMKEEAARNETILDA